MSKKVEVVDVENEALATAVLHLMKRSLRRMYGLLIIFIILFVISMVDSIYQRCRIIDLIEQYEIVEETIVTEDYDVVQDGEDNNNNFITGDNNEVNNGTKD